MSRRLPMVALFAGAAIAIAFALFRMVWFRGEFLLGAAEIRLLGHNTEYVVTGGAFNSMCLIIGIVGVYYTLRLVFMAVTLLANTPINHTVAWISPRSACLQGGLVLVFAIITVAITPSAHFEYTAFEIENLARDWAAPAVLLGGIVLSLAGMIVVARVPELAATQGWLPPPPPEGHELLADLEPMRRERPMTRPPLSSSAAGTSVLEVAAVDANPMRSPPINDLRAKTVKTAREPDAPPIADDPDAPKPKFLA